MAVSYTHLNGKEYIFIDTAGLRRKNKIKEELERYMIVRTVSAVERADVVVLVIDAEEGAVSYTHLDVYKRQRSRSLRRSEKRPVECRWENSQGILPDVFIYACNEPKMCIRDRDNTVAVHIRHIREKIEINPKEPRYLKVVWGVGYKIEKQP